MNNLLGLVFIVCLSPVYDQGHMFDIRKRVFFPLSKSIKIVIKPSPYYSLASTGTALETIINIISNVQNGRRTINVSDVNPIGKMN